MQQLGLEWIPMRVMIRKCYTDCPAHLRAELRTLQPRLTGVNLGTLRRCGEVFVATLLIAAQYKKLDAARKH